VPHIRRAWIVGANRGRRGRFGSGGGVRGRHLAIGAADHYFILFILEAELTILTRTPEEARTLKRFLIPRRKLRNVSKLFGKAAATACIIDQSRLPSRPGRDRDTARATLGQGLAVSAFPRSVPV
jgi:hypothetical protein